MRYQTSICLALFFINSACADEFEFFEGKALLAVTKSADAKAVDRLSMNDLGALPNLLKETRATLLIAITTKGNVVRLLVNPELRKPESGGEPFPIFLLERFDTFDIEDLSSRMAKGRDIVLFPGFQIDLDTGQIVPQGLGGDLALTDKEGLALVTLKGARLFTLSKAPAHDSTKPPQPTPGRSVVPGDFAGRYRLFANGQWSGTLDLAVDPKHEVTGQFRSDNQGVAYPITGQVAADVPNKITMTVKFPRSRGQFVGYIWTQGKGALAGTFHVDDRTYGFFAIREGGRFATEGTDVGMIGAEAVAKSRLTVEMAGDQFLFEGKKYALEALTEVLRSRKFGAKPPAVLIRAAGETQYESVRRAIEAIEAAGLHDIGLANASKSD